MDEQNDLILGRKDRLEIGRHHAQIEGIRLPDEAIRGDHVPDAQIDALMREFDVELRELIDSRHIHGPMRGVILPGHGDIPEIRMRPTPKTALHAHAAAECVRNHVGSVQRFFDIHIDRRS